jgi:hypothetical protein
MVELKKDSKSPTYILTKIDSEGFHRQVNLTVDELISLKHILIKLSNI